MLELRLSSYRVGNWNLGPFYFLDLGEGGISGPLGYSFLRRGLLRSISKFRSSL